MTTEPWVEEGIGVEEYEGVGAIEPWGETGQGFKPLPELRDWEADLAKASPWIYGAIASGLHIFPFASYGLPSKRDEFMQLDQRDQHVALMWEAAGAAMWGFAPQIFKGVGATARFAIGRPAKFAYGKLKTPPPRPPQAYEDVVKSLTTQLEPKRFKPFSYADEVKTRLVNRGFGADEAEAMASALHGDEGALLNVVMERGFKGRASTKPFTEATKWRTGGAYPRRVMTKKFTEEFGEDLLRSKYYQKQFEDVLMKEVYRVKASDPTVKGIFRAHLERSFPGKGKLGFGEVTPEQMANVLDDMLANKNVASSIANPTLFSTLHPARVALGYGERAWGTLTNVYKPMKAALGRVNQDYFQNSLLWAKMLEQRGAYTAIKVKPTGEFTVTKAKWLTPALEDEVYTVLRAADELTAKAYRLGKVEAETIKAEVNELFSGLSTEAKVLTETWKRYSDHLYGDHVKKQIPRLFKKAGMTRAGWAQVEKMMAGSEGIYYQTDRLFSTTSNLSATEKIVGMKELLKGVQKRATMLLEVDRVNPGTYFTSQGKALDKAFTGLGKELGWARGGFMRYLDNYVARVAAHEDGLLQGWRENLFGRKQAFHTKIRQLEKAKGEPVDFGTMLSARTISHAKEHFLYDKLDEMITFSKNLPPHWAQYVESYASGIMGVPTRGDYMLANFFTRTVGGMERLLGKEGLWSEHRVVNFAYTLNNLTYLGGLGFKPFSAMRNLFQPLITVPADLGGLRDLGRLVEGYRWAMNPKNRAFIRQIGAITEYAPEIHLRPQMMPRGLVIGGKELPSLERVRDVAMWMFRGSDRFNRYVTGGAAAVKWDKMAKGIGTMSPRKVKWFSRKMGFDRRREWTKIELEDLLHRGKVDDARSFFINDVIADTQYLYGAADAPVVLRKYGAAGRTGTIFQSWWMNYGSLIHKWLTTGQSPGAKVERLLTMLTAQSMAYSLMRPMWGEATATRTIGFGPFPREFNEFLLPPAWAPVYHAAAAVLNIQTPDVSSRHAKAVLDTAMILAPGSLQFKGMLKGAMDEGFEGFAKSIIRMK